MRGVIQRVTEARVDVGGATVGRIEAGLCVLAGVEQGDVERDASWLAEKVATARIFEDAAGKMNLSVLDVGGAVLAVSQFTLLGDLRKGRRPSFGRAMEPRSARELFDKFCVALRERGLTVETGQFQAKMQVHLVNAGPVTLLLDSHKLF